jgi:hypothetical protein
MNEIITEKFGSYRYYEETLKRVKNVSVQRTFDVNGKYSIQIVWDTFIPGVEVIDGFNVYRSVDLKEWKKLNSTLITINNFLDSDAKLFIGQDYYYKVTFISNGIESSLEEAEPVTFLSSKNKVDGMNWRLYNTSLEHMRRLSLVLRHTGEEVIFGIRQFVGQKCRRCYDFVAKKATDSSCPVCFGTGIEQGYKGIEGRVHFEPATLTISRELEGFIPAYAFRCWTLSFPLLSSQDFIIRKRTGERYVINESTPIINQGLILMQTLRVDIMVREHPLYNIPVV